MESGGETAAGTTNGRSAMCISHLKVEVCCDSEEWATGQLALGLVFSEAQTLLVSWRVWQVARCISVQGQWEELYIIHKSWPWTVNIYPKWTSTLRKHNIGDRCFRSNKRKEKHSKMRKHAHEFGRRRKCIRLSAVVRVQRSLRQWTTSSLF